MSMLKSVGAILAALFLSQLVLLQLSRPAPAQAAGVSIRGYFTSAFTDAAYQQKMVSRVIARWNPKTALPLAGKKPVFITKLTREGQLAYKKLHLSSGSATFDKAAEKCIDTAGPFDPIPASFRYQYLEVHFHFEVVK